MKSNIKFKFVRDNPIMFITISAMFMGLTWMLVGVPAFGIKIGPGLIHLADVILVITLITLPIEVGMIAALGLVLGDLSGAWASFAPGTFMARMALVLVFVVNPNSKSNKINFIFRLTQIVVGVGLSQIVASLWAWHLWGQAAFIQQWTTSAPIHYGVTVAASLAVSLAIETSGARKFIWSSLKINRTDTHKNH